MAVGIHDAEGLLGNRRSGARQQRILELQHRRLDPLKAMRGKDRHQPLDGGSLDLSLRLQHVAQAGRQQGRVLRCVVHPAAVLAFGIEKGRPGALPPGPHRRRCL